MVGFFCFVLFCFVVVFFFFFFLRGGGGGGGCSNNYCELTIDLRQSTAGSVVVSLGKENYNFFQSESECLQVKSKVDRVNKGLLTGLAASSRYLFNCLTVLSPWYC